MTRRDALDEIARTVLGQARKSPIFPMSISQEPPRRHLPAPRTMTIRSNPNANLARPPIDRSASRLQDEMT